MLKGTSVCACSVYQAIAALRADFGISRVRLRVVSCPSHPLSSCFRCSVHKRTPLDVNFRGVLFSVRPGAVITGSNYSLLTRRPELCWRGVSYAQKGFPARHAKRTGGTGTETLRWQAGVQLSRLAAPILKKVGAKMNANLQQRNATRLPSAVYRPTKNVKLAP